jgi:hypothetical protein
LLSFRAATVALLAAIGFVTLLVRLEGLVAFRVAIP